MATENNNENPLIAAITSSNVLFVSVDPGIKHVGFVAMVATRNYDEASGLSLTDATIVARKTFPITFFQPTVTAPEAAVRVTNELINGLISSLFPTGPDGVRKTFLEAVLVVEKQFIQGGMARLGTQLVGAEFALMTGLYGALQSFNYNAVTARSVQAGQVKAFFKFTASKQQETTFKLEAMKKRTDIKDLTPEFLWTTHEADAFWQAVMQYDIYIISMVKALQELNIKDDERQQGTESADGLVGTASTKGTKAKKSRPRPRKNNAPTSTGSSTAGPVTGNEQDDQT